jgi:glycosyltransferase involved in cell wall biosynthesis
MKRPAATEAGVLLFSKDRALQCDGALRSLHEHGADVGECSIVVLFACSSELHARTYARLKEDWPQVCFVQETDFRAEVLRLIESRTFVLFLVDDSIAVRPFSIAALCEALRRDSRALGVSLRLGRETRYCYSLSRPQRPPSFSITDDGLLRYRWEGADADYGYALEISSSLYRRGEVEEMLRNVPFENPTSLEDRLAEALPLMASSKPFLLCPETALVFSNPLNRVQQIAHNRSGLSPGNEVAALAALYEIGERIDAEAYSGFRPNACHQEVPLVLQSIRSRDVPWPPRAGPQPTLSVLMPARNAAPYIREALDSILAQTFGDFEVLLFDDGSTDATRSIAASIPDPRIRISGTRTSRGIVSVLNDCLHEARGRFIARADADDIAHALRFERQVAFLDSHPDVGVCGTWMTSFGDGNENLYAFPAAHEEIVADLLFNPSVVHPTVMFRAALEESGDIRWREGFDHAEDYEWLIRLSSFTRFANVTESLYAYRVHPGQVGSVHAAEQDAITQRLQRELIERLVPSVGDREWRMHVALTRWRIPASPDALDEIHDWFHTLCAANDRLGIYDRVACRKVIARRFFHVAAYYAPFGIAAWWKARRLPLYQAAPVSARSRVSQFRNFLLRRDVPGRRFPAGGRA